MLECPMTVCTRFGVHPRCAMNRLAAACRRAWKPYLAAEVGSPSIVMQHDVLKGHEYPLAQILQRLDAAMPIREHEIDLPRRTDRAPKPQRIHHHGGKGNVPATGLRLRRSDAAPCIGALPNVNGTGH